MFSNTADPSQEASRPLPRLQATVATPAMFLGGLRALRSIARTLRDQQPEPASTLNYSVPNERSL